MDKIDVSKFNMAIQNQANMASGIFAEIEAQRQSTIDAIEKANREKAKNDEEKRAALKRIADNSEQTVESLKEANEILKENNQLLKEKNATLSQKLKIIIDVIEQLSSQSKEMGEDQEEMMRQALALAVQLNVTAEEKGKFDWKEILANTSISSLMLGLQLFFASAWVNVDHLQELPLGTKGAPYL